MSTQLLTVSVYLVDTLWLKSHCVLVALQSFPPEENSAQLWYLLPFVQLVVQPQLSRLQVVCPGWAWGVGQTGARGPVEGLSWPLFWEWLQIVPLLQKDREGKGLNNRDLDTVGLGSSAFDCAAAYKITVIYVIFTCEQRHNRAFGDMLLVHRSVCSSHGVHHPHGTQKWFYFSLERLQLCSWVLTVNSLGVDLSRCRLPLLGVVIHWISLTVR